MAKTARPLTAREVADNILSDINMEALPAISKPVADIIVSKWYQVKQRIVSCEFNH